MDTPYNGHGSATYIPVPVCIAASSTIAACVHRTADVHSTYIHTCMYDVLCTCILYYVEGTSYIVHVVHNST